MKNKFILLLCGLLLAMGQSASAQTPDGETPANEGVCDVLQEDGVTKGLYGLCVAFCEAQDVAVFSVPLTEEELADLANSKPAGRILANYNKKMQDTDPAMPCIVVEEPCPCWSEEEIGAIDGTLWNGESGERVRCVDFNNNVVEQTFIYEEDAYPYGNQYDGFTIAQVYKNFDNGRGFCRYQERINHDPNDPDVVRYLYLENGDITTEEHDACRESVRARIEVAACNNL